MTRYSSHTPQHETKIIPWKSDLIGALVEYSPDAIIIGHKIRNLSKGNKGIITKGEWVNNGTVGTSFCAYNICWLGIGNSEDLSSFAHFTTKDVKVIALPEIIT